jgi:hypothetical protein
MPVSALSLQPLLIGLLTAGTCCWWLLVGLNPADAVPALLPLWLLTPLYGAVTTRHASSLPQPGSSASLDQGAALPELLPLILLCGAVTAT